MSIGEDRVRVKFNPSADSVVDQIKQETAKLIDLCHELLVSRGIVRYRKPTANELADPEWWGHSYDIGPEDDGVVRGNE